MLRKLEYYIFLINFQDFEYGLYAHVLQELHLIQIQKHLIRLNADSIFFKLTPLSINNFVFSVSTYKQFPLLPLYKLQKFNICIPRFFIFPCNKGMEITKFFYSVILSIFAPKLRNFCSIFS